MMPGFSCQLEFFWYHPRHRICGTQRLH